jgi:hypothetical protein
MILLFIWFVNHGNIFQIFEALRYPLKKIKKGPTEDTEWRREEKGNRRKIFFYHRVEIYWKVW